MIIISCNVRFVSFFDRHKTANQTEAYMNKCPNCGNKLSNIDVLCPRCGALVEVIQIKSSGPVGTVPDSQNSRDENQKDEPGKHKKEFPNLIVYNEDLPPENFDTQFSVPDDLPVPPTKDTEAPEYPADTQDNLPDQKKRYIR